MPFKPGKSGNPNGRPKKSIEEVYTRSIYTAVTPEDLKEIAAMLAKAAKRGDVQAAKLLLSYIVGVPVQRNEITGADGGTVKISVNLKHGEEV
jgi:hypothetical protein